MKRKMGKGKAKGTVLFTVVTVMLVMVVLLMTTLTLTTSAKRRSYYTYFESQAQYAANAAIDAVTFSAYSDGAFHDWVTHSVTNSADPQGRQDGEIHVKFDGTEIQFTDTPSDETDDMVVCRIEKLNPEVVWDDATRALHPRETWRITATASVGNGRNVSTYSVSQYLYENFQAPVQSLPVEALNRGTYTVSRIEQQQGQQNTPTPTYSSPAMLSFGNVGFVNNNITLGPCYSNLATLPLGMFRRNNNTSFYESIDTSDKYYKGEWNESWTGKDPYNLYITNDKMMTVGNCIFVNNLYSRVKTVCEFQSAREGVTIYGDLNCDNQGLFFRSKVSNAVSDVFTKASNYVYVDGMVRFPTNTGFALLGETGSVLPINLYCGGVDTGNNGGRKLSVSGDVYMYDPNANSTWCKGDDASALNNFVTVQVNKVANVSDYMKASGGNIVCNNQSLTLYGGNADFVVPGDIIMTKNGSTLTLGAGVKVDGQIISVGTVNLNGATSSSGGAIPVTTGDAAWAKASANYDGNYTASQNKGEFDYRLMPYISRLDELFQTYYRWDLAVYQDANPFTVDGNGNLTSNDDYIKESQACGHEWKVKDFNTPTGKAWVPYTTSLKGYWMIPTHTYSNPESAIGNLVANGITSVTSYDEFLRVYNNNNALPAYSGTAKTIATISHDASGRLATGTDAVTLTDYYVVDSSCEIDTNQYSKIFVDPSNLTGTDTINIVLKGHPQYSGQDVDFVVNNTASYSGGNYSSPTAYIDDNKFVARSQVRVFLKDDFGCPDDSFIMNLYMRTTGILRQWNAGEMSVVQSPTYPDEAGWSTLSGNVKFAYELVPNFTVYGEAGHTYLLKGNADMLNADVAMPVSSLVFNTVNSGNKHITYRERCDVTTPSEGTTYVWAVGSFMVDTIDLNDRCAMTAYIGSMGTDSNPPRVVVPTVGGNDSDANGENNVRNFDNSHRGAA